MKLLLAMRARTAHHDRVLAGGALLLYVALWVVLVPIPSVHAVATITHGVSASSTANNAALTTGTFTTAANDLLVACAVYSGVTTAATMTVTDVQSLGWTKINVATYSASANTLWCFVANTLAASGSTETVTFTSSVAGTGINISVERVAGITRVGSTGAVRQSAVTNNGAASGTPAATFGAAALTANPVFGFVGNSTNPATMTPPGGTVCNGGTFTEQADVGYNTPATGEEVATCANGFTASTVTWGGTSASVFGVVTFELDMTATATSSCRWVPSSNSFANNSASTNPARLTTIDFWLPWTTLSGNAIPVWVTGGNRTDWAASATDDGGNSYVQIGPGASNGNFKDTTNNQAIALLLATNTAPAKHITVTLTAGSGPGTTVNFGGGVAGECSNVSTAAPASVVDVVNGNFSSGTSASCGALATTIDNDLILHFGDLDNLSVGTGDSWASQSGFTLDTVELNSWMAHQSEQQGAHASITPAFTLGTSTSFVTGCAALRTSTAGTAFPSSGLRITCMQRDNTQASGNITLQFPCTGVNTFVLLADFGASAGAVTSITDTQSNTYTVDTTNCKVANGGGGPTIQVVTSKGYSGANGNTLTVSRGADATGAAYVLVGIAGADSSSPFNATPCVTNSGNQTTQASPLNLVTGTPSQTGSLFFAHANWVNGTANGATTPTGVVFITSTANLNLEFEPHGMDENGESVFVTTTSTSAITFNRTQGDSLAAGFWAAAAIEVLPPAAVTVTPASKVRKLSVLDPGGP